MLLKKSFQGHRIAGCIRIVAAGVVTTVLLAAQQPSKADEAAAADLQAIQAKRISTLEELHKLSQTRYSQGQGQLATVLEAMIELGAARVEDEDTSAGRIKVLRSMVTMWTQLESTVRSRVDSGMAPLEDLLRVRARRLNAELKLARQVSEGRASAHDKPEARQGGGGQPAARAESK